MSSDKDTNQNDKPNISNDLVDISSDSSNGKTEPQKIKIDDKDLSHSERPAKRPRISVEQSERKVIDLDDPKIKEISKNNETKTEQSQSAQNLPPLKEDEHQFQWGVLISQCRMQTQFLVNHKITIGASRSCNIRLHDYGSAVMANIIYDNNNVTLEVLDSSVSIYLNGSELSETSVYNLVSGDDITIQSYRTYLSFIIEIFDAPVPFEDKLNNYDCNNIDRLNESSWGIETIDMLSNTSNNNNNNNIIGNNYIDLHEDSIKIGERAIKTMNRLADEAAARAAALTGSSSSTSSSSNNNNNNSLSNPIFHSAFQPIGSKPCNINNINNKNKNNNNNNNNNSTDKDKDKEKEKEKENDKITITSTSTGSATAVPSLSSILKNTLSPIQPPPPPSILNDLVDDIPSIIKGQFKNRMDRNLSSYMRNNYNNNNRAINSSTTGSNPSTSSSSSNNNHRKIYREVNPNIITEQKPPKLPNEDKILEEITKHINSYYESKIITPENNKYTLESLRYPLNTELITLLKTVTDFYTHNSDKVNNISKLESISRFILLQCPEYTDILQECLIGYIAKELNVNYMVLDSNEWEISNEESYPKNETYFLLGNPDNIFPDSLLRKINYKNENRSTSSSLSTTTTNASTSSSLLFNDTQSVTANSTNTNSNNSNNIIVNNITKKYHINDRVCYIGDILSKHNSRMNPYEYRRFNHQICGPNTGMKGTIIAIYDKSSVPKVGIQFDKMVNGGNTIGQRCPNRYGFIVPVIDIELAEDSDWKELIERTALELLLMISTGTMLHSNSYKPWEENNGNNNGYGNGNKGGLQCFGKNVSFFDPMDDYFDLSGDDISSGGGNGGIGSSGAIYCPSPQYEPNTPTNTHSMIEEEDEDDDYDDDEEEEEEGEDEDDDEDDIFNEITGGGNSSGSGSGNSGKNNSKRLTKIITSSIMNGNNNNNSNNNNSNSNNDKFTPLTPIDININNNNNNAETTTTTTTTNENNNNLKKKRKKSASKSKPKKITKKDNKSMNNRSRGNSRSNSIDIESDKNEENEEEEEEEVEDVDEEEENNNNNNIKHKQQPQQQQPFIVFFKNLHIGTSIQRLKFLRKYLLSLPSNIKTVFIASSKLSKTESSKKSSMSKKPSYGFTLFHYDMPRGRRQKSNLSLHSLFSYNLKLLSPKGGRNLSDWNNLIEEDKHKIIYNRNHRVIELLTKHLPFKIEDDNLAVLSEKVLTINNLREIIGISYANYCNNNNKIENNNNNNIIKSNTLSDTLTLLSKMNEYEKDNSKVLKKEIECDNEFEESLLSDAVLSPDNIGVKFDDIGSLDKIKEILYELVTLPLVRPELFRRGQLRCPCRGILLFGPPGTGKTMLAKGIASESKANFLNVSISDIVSKWFGEAEKYVKAVFTLARKLTPCVIFVDEIDALLSKRSAKSEHEVSRKMKNEFMSNWDGMSSKETERIIVVGCTNRPFDLDDAVLRRFPRRLFIDIPTAEERKLILQTIIKDEELEPSFDIDRIASDEITKGFSGSDLKNLCINAAYYPLREYIDEEKEMKKKGMNETEILSLKRQLRPLKTEDFEKARKEINWSYKKDSENDHEMRQWNEEFGDGAKPEQQELTYYS